MKIISNLIGGLIIIMFFSACAFDLVHVKQYPTQMDMSQLSKSSFELLEEVHVSLGTGYSRKLIKGTRWGFVGVISEGDVYKTGDQILTIEGSNIFEAYIVVLEEKIVGFYLPVEKTYSPLSSPQELQVEVINLNN